MPLILAPADYVRWLSDEPDPRDLMQPFPAEPMRMWPISTRVNKPENDDPSIVEPIELSVAKGDGQASARVSGPNVRYKADIAPTCCGVG